MSNELIPVHSIFSFFLTTNQGRQSFRFLGKQQKDIIDRYFGSEEGKLVLGVLSRFYKEHKRLPETYLDYNIFTSKDERYRKYHDNLFATKELDDKYTNFLKFQNQCFKPITLTEDVLNYMRDMICTIRFIGTQKGIYQRLKQSLADRELVVPHLTETVREEQKFLGELNEIFEKGGKTTSSRNMMDGHIPIENSFPVYSPRFPLVKFYKTNPTGLTAATKKGKSLFMLDIIFELVEKQGFHVLLFDMENKSETQVRLTQKIVRCTEIEAREDIYYDREPLISLGIMELDWNAVIGHYDINHIDNNSNRGVIEVDLEEQDKYSEIPKLVYRIEEVQLQGEELIKNLSTGKKSKSELRFYKAKAYKKDVFYSFEAIPFQEVYDMVPEIDEDFILSLMEPLKPRYEARIKEIKETSGGQIELPDATLLYPDDIESEIASKIGDMSSDFFKNPDKRFVVIDWMKYAFVRDPILQAKGHERIMEFYRILRDLMNAYSFYCFTIHGISSGDKTNIGTYHVDVQELDPADCKAVSFTLFLSLMMRCSQEEFDSGCRRIEVHHTRRKDKHLAQVQHIQGDWEYNEFKELDIEHYKRINPKYAKYLEEDVTVNEFTNRRRIIRLEDLGKEDLRSEELPDIDNGQVEDAVLELIDDIDEDNIISKYE